VSTSHTNAAGVPAWVEALRQAQPYAPGRVDRTLLDEQTFVTSETRDVIYAPPARVASPAAGSRPRLEQIVERVAGGHAEAFAKVVALTRWCSRIPREYPSADANTASGIYGDFSRFSWGGDEEAVIAKGSPWPQELARVLATLSQFAGVPARLVFLYRGDPPELHSVVEAWAPGSWTVFDACANRFYPWPHHGYASALDLQRQPQLIDRAPEHGRLPWVDSAFYRTIGIASYPLVDRERFGYEQQPALPQDLARLRFAAEGFSR
jgi:transglutaminase-like putative cysteine protease